MRILTLLVLFSFGLCSAQGTEDCKPSSLNIPAAKYPCVYPDGRATFRVVAPDAHQVQVRIGKPYDMVKADDGAWTVTTAPLVVGFHYYSLAVDGAVVADPSTRTFLDLNREALRHGQSRRRGMDRHDGAAGGGLPLLLAGRGRRRGG